MTPMTDLDEIDYRRAPSSTQKRSSPRRVSRSSGRPRFVAGRARVLPMARIRVGESPVKSPELARLLDAGRRVTLPDEAQWEKAARGTDGRIFPWGNEPMRDRANYRGSSTMKVGSFECAECAFGLSDMSGNVWELTRSPYRPYPFDPHLENVDLDADALWVMRGGAYGDPEQNVRTAIRGGADPGARRPFIGFRIALTRTAP